MDAVSAARKNVAHSRMIREALGTALKSVAVPAISMTLREVSMQTWQDSSNAAFNWYVVSEDFSTPDYKEYKGVSPVGSEGDYRSRNQLFQEMQIVAMSVMKRELPKIKATYDRRAPRDLSFYNTVEQHSDAYFHNAEVYKTLNDPEVTVTFDKTSALKFAEWKSQYGF